MTDALLADTENWFWTNFGPNVAKPLRIRPTRNETVAEDKLISRQ